MQRAVVTGAAGGIGRAIAEKLAAEGWTVVRLDLIEGPHVEQVDVTDAEALRAAIEDSGPLDALVNNAAVMVSRPLVELESQEWERMIAVNLTAAFNAIRFAHAQLSATKGSVVNVASVHALATSAGASGYAATKAGLVGLTRGAAVELGPSGIRVNAVLPGATRTEMLGVDPDDPADVAGAQLVGRTPLGRVAEPEEIAELVAFLTDPRRAGFVTGQTFVADGGVLARLASE